MQRGGSDDQWPSGLQVSRLAPSTRKPESQLYCRTVPTGKEPRLLSLRLVEPCCTMTGLTHTRGRERGRGYTPLGIKGEKIQVHIVATPTH